MERIKKLEDIILKTDAILGEIVEIKKSGIILPGIENSGDMLDHIKIVAVGSKIEDLKPGDYVLDMISADLPVYVINGTKYGLIYRGNVRIAVKSDNFDLTKEDNSDLTS